RYCGVQHAWLCLFAFTLLTCIYFVVEGVPRFRQSYLSAYLTASGSIVDRLFHSTKFFGVVAILMVFAVHRTRRLPGAAAAVPACVIFMNLLMGSRSLPFIYALAALVCIDRFVWRLTIVEVAALAVGASALSF